MNPEMTSEQPSDSDGPVAPVGEPEKFKPADLGLTERRRSVRPLPAPEAVENDGDSAWAAFQSLISDNSET